MIKSREFLGKRIKHGKYESKVDFDIYLKVPKINVGNGDVWLDLFKRLSGVCLRYFALTAEKVYSTEVAIFWVKVLRVMRNNAKDMEIKGELKNLSKLLEENYYKVDKIRIQKNLVPDDYLEKRQFVLEEFQKNASDAKGAKNTRKKLKVAGGQDLPADFDEHACG